VGRHEAVSTIGEPVPEALDWLRPELGELHRTYQQLSRQTDAVSAFDQALLEVLDPDQYSWLDEFFRGEMDPVYGIAAGQRARDALGFWLASPRAYEGGRRTRFNWPARIALAILLLAAVGAAIEVAAASSSKPQAAKTAPPTASSSKPEAAKPVPPAIDRRAIAKLPYMIYVPSALPHGWVLEGAGVVPAITGNTTCNTLEIDYRPPNSAVPVMQVYEVPTACGEGVPPGSQAIQAGPFSGFIGTDPVSREAGLRLYAGGTTIIAYADVDQATLIRTFSSLGDLKGQ